MSYNLEYFIWRWSILCNSWNSFRNDWIVPSRLNAVMWAQWWSFVFQTVKIIKGKNQEKKISEVLALRTQLESQGELWFWVLATILMKNQVLWRCLKVYSNAALRNIH